MDPAGWWALCRVGQSAVDRVQGGGDETGFFVSAAAVGVPDGGDAGGAGTRAKPYRTIGEAIAGLKTRPTVPARIYVCGGDYAETVTLDETLGRGVQIYGQMSCTTWGWSWQSADRVRVKPTEGRRWW